MRHIIRCRSHDAKASKAVAQTQRNQFGDSRVLLQGFHLCQRDIARGRIDMKHARQNQLHGAAFGTDDDVNALQIALKSMVDLAADEQNQRDGRHAQRQQQHIQSRSQRA